MVSSLYKVGRRLYTSMFSANWINLKHTDFKIYKYSYFFFSYINQIYCSFGSLHLSSRFTNTQNKSYDFEYVIPM
jgi:hypothetical protein